MWTRIKLWLFSKVQATAIAEINKLDQYEPVLADLIRKQTDPDMRSKQVVDWVQAQLTSIINKAFSAKFLGSWIFSSTKVALLAEVSKLNNYENDIAAFLKSKINPDAQAQLVINYVKDYLTALCIKYISKM